MKKYHFDLIIANPPYGSIGTSITEQVIQNIDYNEYVNLLPVSDYQKGNTTASSYVQTIEDIEDAFEDAAVTTSLAKISKSVCNTFDSKQLKITKMDFSLLTKFFRRNAELVELYKMPIRQRSFHGMENKFAVAIGRRDAAMDIYLILKLLFNIDGMYYITLHQKKCAQFGNPTKLYELSL